MLRLLLVLSLITPAFGQIALVGSVAKNAGLNDANVTGFNATGANLLVVVVAAYALSASGATLTSTPSNTWELCGVNHASDTGNAQTAIFYVRNPSVSGSMTINANRNGGYPLMFVGAYSGADTTAPCDQTNGSGPPAGSTTVQTGSITPSVDGSLVVTGETDETSTDKTVNSPYTRQDVVTSTSFSVGAWATNIQTTATATNPTWTSTTGAKATVIASFKPSAGGGGSPAPARRRPIN